MIVWIPLFFVQDLDQVISVIVFFDADLRQLDPSFLEWIYRVSIQAPVETAGSFFSRTNHPALLLSPLSKPKF